ncbi:MAG TPA: NADH-dependent [FeFe] hydrogenase, group A6 [Clostridia bacterium]|nr:NADH-dependent [FeFe] hydrogenase, group A6 [Clostridia bacterium]
MAQLNVKINGKPYTVNEGTILEACQQAGVRVPTLCYLKDLNPLGACRLCVVEVKGARDLPASCVTPVSEGMEIWTSTKKVLDSRKMTLELMLSNHNNDCNSCVRSGSCELQSLANEYSCDVHRFAGEVTKGEEEVTPYLIRDNSKCILCRRCVAACSKLQHVAVIGPNKRGFNTYIGTAYGMDLAGSGCVSCGQCINVCPTGALREKDDTDKVYEAINDPTKHVVIMPAPAIRVAIGEEFGYPIGTNQQGKMVAAMRRLGVDAVLDVDFTADLTIMEEGTELLHRLQGEGPLPMFTSCSPGWINYIEQYYPEFLPNLSSCKSPHMMSGAIVKTYYAMKKGIDPKDIYTVTVMPCVAKKGEIIREDINASGYKDIDCVITTRELARMIKRSGIMFKNLPDEDFDEFVGRGSTAGLLFGATGGVMEAALRTVAEILEKKPLPKLEFESVRGTEGIKRANVHVAGKDLGVIVASGIENAHTLMEELKAGKLSDVAFIEIMCCPGGCVAGGGQPIQPADVWNTTDVRGLRAKAIYDTDASSKARKSHENKEVSELYANFLGEPNGHKAHELLHTTYRNRSIHKK